jgi:hypothetical protein
MRPRRLLLLLVLATCAPAQQNLELGKMWTFEKPPLAYLEKEYGFKPTQEWLDGLRLASLRFGNWCSSSFFSPKGLIMTNHHCLRDAVAKVSPREKDWVANGYYASEEGDEVRLTDVSVSQLVAMVDVTARIEEGVTDGDDARTSEKKRDANEEKVLAEAKERQPKLKPQVVKLHQGARFMLYSYRVWDDVRLVCAPHLQTAHFGGDPDNFTYPRYSIDFAFCRAYEDGKPADTSKHYFRWSKSGPKENELVFVTGNPGSSGRLLTYAQLEYLRDAEYPLQLAQLDSQVEILHSFMSQNPELERQMKTQALMLENSQKAIRGYYGGLLDAELMAGKRAAEAAFKTKVLGDPALAAKYGKAWDRLAEVSNKKAALFSKAVLQVPAYSQVLVRATAIANAVNEDLDAREREVAKKQAEGFRFRPPSPIGVALLKNHFALAVRFLGQDDPYVKALVGERQPDQVVELLAQSKVKDDDLVKELLDGGKEVVAKCADQAVAVGRLISKLAHTNHAQMAELAAEESALGAQIGRALFAVYGDGFSPDATMTLRFSDGLTKGYPYNGTLAPWRTTFHGLYARNLEFDGKHPFDLPSPWLDLASTIDMSKSVCFVSTNDIIGGNSGSPVVNQELEVVGLIFDGNIESLANRFVFRDKTQRSVSVHVDAIIEALRKVYGAEKLAAELLAALAPGNGAKKEN